MDNFNPLPHEPLKTQLELAIESLEGLLDKNGRFENDFFPDEDKVERTIKVSLGLLKEYKRAEEGK